METPDDENHTTSVPHPRSRMKGQLPKAYLRLDPNADQHPDRDGYLLMACSANRQHPRGRFRRETVVALLGRKRAGQWMTPRPGRVTPELVEQPDGTLYLDGWDELQEGDWTVGERMRRMRDNRNSTVTTTVTSPYLDRNPPSEALGVKALGVNERTETTEKRIPPPADFSPPSWSREASDDWTASKGGPPPALIFVALKAAVTAHGWPIVRPVWQFYLAATAAEFVNVPKFTASFGEWEKRTSGQRAPGGKQTSEAATMAAASAVLARHEGRRT